MKGEMKREISPLEVAIQQLDIAAEMLNLEPGICMVLKKPKRSLIVSVPIKRDNGEIEVYTGFRVQHNDARGPYKGGRRYHPDITLEEGTALAMWTTWKCEGSLRAGSHRGPGRRQSPRSRTSRSGSTEGTQSTTTGRGPSSSSSGGRKGPSLRG